MKTALSLSRTTEDKAWERQMELSRGNRFEEMVSLSIYGDDPNEVIGFIHGILYLADVMNEVSSELIRKIKDSPVTDGMTHNILEREYVPEMQRNLLVLVDPIVCESTVPTEDVLEALQLFVEDYYGYSINSIYSLETQQWNSHSLPSGKSIYEFFPGEETTDIEGLLVYDYGL